MSWPVSVLRAVAAMEHVQKDLEDHFVGRERAARLLVLAAVCREHMLLLGPPGTAKTALISRFTQLLKADVFSYLLSRFTEPAEIFGPLDYPSFQQGQYQVRTVGMLPQARFAFLDEVYQGSSAILNTLLALLNERVFHNGSRAEGTRLISLFGASSEVPEDPALKAFGDRFLLRMEVRSVARTDLPGLLDLGWGQERERLTTFDQDYDGPQRDPVTPIVTDPGTLTLLHQSLSDVRLQHVLPAYTDLIRDLLGEGVVLTDRRIVRGQKLVAAAALLRREQTATPRDLWPLAHLWTEPGDEQPTARLVAERVAADGGATDQVRGAAEILAVAESRTRSVLERAPGAGVRNNEVMSVLRELHDIERELNEHHPGDEPALQHLRGLRGRVAELLDQWE
ncbi:AAA family ATPase [Streptomyces sp. NPDC002742]|uniref:AAA family ATPase n=1 Tax=Streptomyces sp. NPDC002742 TaxID=3364663 RepID=UPI0036940103